MEKRIEVVVDVERREISIDDVNTSQLFTQAFCGNCEEHQVGRKDVLNHSWNGNCIYAKCVRERTWKLSINEL